jgi:hypothetical protein
MGALPPTPSASPPRYLKNQRSNSWLTEIAQVGVTVQAEEPMTVTEEAPCHTQAGGISFLAGIDAAP